MSDDCAELIVRMEMLERLLDARDKRAAEAKENEEFGNGDRASYGEDEGALEAEDPVILEEVEEMSDDGSWTWVPVAVYRTVMAAYLKIAAEAREREEREGKRRTCLELMRGMMAHCRIHQRAAYQQGLREGWAGRVAGRGVGTTTLTSPAHECIRRYGAREPPRVPQSLGIEHGTSTPPARSVIPVTVVRTQEPPSDSPGTQPGSHVDGGTQILEQVQSLSRNQSQTAFPPSHTIMAKVKWEHLRLCRDRARSFLQDGVAISDIVFAKLLSDSILKSPFLPLGAYVYARTRTLAWSLNQVQSKMLKQQAKGTFTQPILGREARGHPLVRRWKALRRDYPNLREMIAEVWGQRVDDQEDVPILSRNRDWEDEKAERAKAAADRIKTEWPGLSMWLLGEPQGEYPGERLSGTS